jgi:hypothetical protein
MSSKWAKRSSASRSAPSPITTTGAVGPVRAREPGEAQLAGELHAVLVVAGDDHRAPPRRPQVGGDPHRDLGVAGDQPQDGAAVAGEVVAAGLVVARDGRGRRHRREQRQAGRRRGLDRVGHLDGAVRPDQRDCPLVGRRGLGGAHRVAVAVRDVRDPRPAQHRVDRARERVGQRRVDRRRHDGARSGKRLIPSSGIGSHGAA